MSKRSNRERRKARMQRIREKYSTIRATLERMGYLDNQITEELQRMRNRDITRASHRR